MLTEKPHPWQSAHDEFTGIVLPVLKFIGKEIGTHASTGCEISQRIMSRYEMIYRSFDPLTLIGLQNALQEYAAKYKSKCEVLQSAGHPSEHECGDLSVGLTVDGTAVCAVCTDNDVLAVVIRAPRS
jgi:hypothetical protein